MDPKIIDDFLRKVWLTRKCRIETAERLAGWDVFFQFLFVYYSLWLVALSIWKLYSDREGITIALLISSVVLFGISQFVAARNFRYRADSMKACYIELDNLQTKLRILKDDLNSCKDPSSSFIEITNHYGKLLSTVENHSGYDYLSALRNSDESFGFIQFIALYFNKFLTSMFKLILLLIPLILVWSIK
jgi:hypothetical protein